MVEYCERIEVNPEVATGKPAIKGSRLMRISADENVPGATVRRPRMRRIPPLALKLFVLLFVLSPSAAVSTNLYLIEADTNGFAIYRSGKPDRTDMAEYCELEIEDMMVLSGNAEDHEYKYADECPSLTVIYNYKQNENVPVTQSFLEDFDAWVMRAKKEGRKIAFRCNCGCHRTGRLAGYYQMKYRGLSFDDAKELMMERGKWMLLYPGLKQQLRAMADYVAGQPCSTESKYCIVTEGGNIGTRPNDMNE